MWGLYTTVTPTFGCIDLFGLYKAITQIRLHVSLFPVCILRQVVQNEAIGLFVVFLYEALYLALYWQQRLATFFFILRNLMFERNTDGVEFSDIDR